MEKEQIPQDLSTRREFLIGTASLAFAAVLPACSQTAKILQTQLEEPEISSVIDRELRVSCYWVARGDHENSYPLFKKMVEATTDFFWLSRGDQVLIKIALNSGKRYPATTDPWSVHCMVKLLKEKGADKILVGDQNGLVMASDDLLAHEMLAYAWLQWNRQFETSSIAHMTMGSHTKSRSRYNKQFSDRMWPDNDGRGTPPIDYFKPGNLYNHPAIVNHLKRMGGRPRNIAVEEMNKQPDRSVIDYLKRQFKV